MLLLPVLVVFCVIMLDLIISDYRTEKSELVKLNGIIESTEIHEYYDNEIYKGKKTYDVLDINLSNDLIIRLSDEFTTKHWDDINNKSNVGKSIIILFHQRLFRDTLVLNPQELVIGKNKILTYENNKTVNLWILVGFSVLLLLLIFLEYWAIKNYKRIHYNEDSKSDSSVIWQIIKKAFKEE